MAFSSELSTAAHGEAVKAGVQHGTLQMYKKSLTREGQTGEARAASNKFPGTSGSFSQPSDRSVHL